jgi:hypothetical protein
LLGSRAEQCSEKESGFLVVYLGQIFNFSFRGLRL